MAAKFGYFRTSAELAEDGKNVTATIEGWSRQWVKGEKDADKNPLPEPQFTLRYTGAVLNGKGDASKLAPAKLGNAPNLEEIAVSTWRLSSVSVSSNGDSKAIAANASDLGWFVGRMIESVETYNLDLVFAGDELPAHLAAADQLFKLVDVSNVPTTKRFDVPGLRRR